ncbi:DNA repair protein RecO [Pseudaestuariivita rosea]|uniref:DNA repair protein RecO n=1 Tax=Pseudaestuariivita rosea TaxID=2763263 RepID=UPI001ABA1EC3
MEWREDGALMAVRKHGETAAIIEVFTKAHGLTAGVVRGASSRKVAPILQPGAQLDVTWKARLEDHIGSYTVEPIRSRAAQVMGDALALAGLNAVCALICFALPEREPHPPLYQSTENLLDLLGQNDLWPLAYLRWEMALLQELGFGLDLSACAVSGATEGLTYVSPKSGRAVTEKGAGDWADKLLHLPPVMLGHGDAHNDEIAQALQTTGYFIEHALATALGNRPVPPARARFLDILHRQSRA